jgi:hypothetical protein
MRDEIRSGEDHVVSLTGTGPVTGASEEVNPDVVILPPPLPGRGNLSAPSASADGAAGGLATPGTSSKVA